MKKERTEFYEDENIRVKFYSISYNSMFFFADKGGIFKLKLEVENKTESSMEVNAVNFEVKGSGLSNTPRIDLMSELKGGKTLMKIFSFDSYVEEILFNIRYNVREKGIDVTIPDRFEFFTN